MKRVSKLVICSILILTVLSVAIMANITLAETNADNETFYVGVTFCGHTVEEAKHMIDKVKDYTNLFIINSGILIYDIPAVEEIGDYAVASGLNFATSFGPYFYSVPPGWVETAQQRWGSNFVGIYFYDEPGGKMLDDQVWLQYGGYDGLIKMNVGGISLHKTTSECTVDEVFYSNDTVRMTVCLEDRSKLGSCFYMYPDGSSETMFDVPWPEERYASYPNKTFAVFTPHTFEVVYYPDGEITVWESNGDVFYTMVNGSQRIAEVEPLSAVLDRNPIKTSDIAAQAFETETARRLKPLENSTIPLFTSDYGLYWWDFRSGYDLVLAQLGWNNTVEQEIALVRGAANLQGKSGGTILTWKYTQPPFLTDGQEMFEQMKTSYETGAQYVIVFNYSEDQANPDTFQDEHYQALERFWTEVVQNPDVVHGSIKAEAALVLPQNYGWGMRNPTDRIGGIWETDSASQQIWNQVQTQLDQYGLKLDIVYEDPDYPIAGRYNNIHYITGAFPYIWIIAALLLLPITAGVLLVYFRRRKNQTTKPSTSTVQTG